LTLVYTRCNFDSIQLRRYVNLENTTMKSFLKIIIIAFFSTGFIAIMQFCQKPAPPSVTTGSVSGVTTISAVSGGNVTNNGGEDVTARGVCWSTTSNPAITSSKTSDGTGNGVFNSSITGLTANMNYHVRAYATNSEGTAYGDELTFTTIAVTSTVPGAPTIGTAIAGNAQASVAFTAPASDGGSAITGYTATPGGLTGTGSASPITITGLTNGTAYTFTVTATNANGTGPASSASNSVTTSAPSTVPGAPTIGTATAGNAQATVTFTAPVNNGGSAITGYTVTSSPGGFTGAGSASPITVTGLTSGTAYTFTVTATNANGTSPASSASNSVTPPVTDGDGNVYNIVTIGTQVWMKENLKTTKYNDGTTIPNVTDNATWAGLGTDAYCWYKNDAATYKATYGALYNWYAVNKGKLCPAGWHVPTDVEWHSLILYMDPAAILGSVESSLAGGKLKETGLTHWLTPNSGATNESGFTALPGGCRLSDATFTDVGFRGYWWGSTESSTPSAYYRTMNYLDVYVLRDIFSKQYGLSVRCVRNN